MTFTTTQIPHVTIFEIQLYFFSQFLFLEL